MGVSHIRWRPWLAPIFDSFAFLPQSESPSPSGAAPASMVLIVPVAVRMWVVPRGNTLCEKRIMGGQLGRPEQWYDVAQVRTPNCDEQIKDEVDVILCSQKGDCNGQVDAGLRVLRDSRRLASCPQARKDHMRRQLASNPCRPGLHATTYTSYGKAWCQQPVPNGSRLSCDIWMLSPGLADTVVQHHVATAQRLPGESVSTVLYNQRNACMTSWVAEEALASHSTTNGQKAWRVESLPSGAAVLRYPEHHVGPSSEVLVALIDRWMGLTGYVVLHTAGQSARCILYISRPNGGETVPPPLHGVPASGRRLTQLLGRVVSEVFLYHFGSQQSRRHLYDTDDPYRVIRRAQCANGKGFLLFTPP